MKSGITPADLFGEAPYQVSTDPERVRAAVELLKSQDLDKVQIDELKRIFDPAFVGIVLQAPLRNPGMPLFRGRPGFKAQRIGQMLYPPADVAPMGRANREGRPMFYCCTARQGPLFEVGPLQPGDVLTLTEWTTTERLLVVPVGYSEEAFRRLSSNRTATTALQFTNDLSSRVTRDLLDLVAELFTRPASAVSDRNQYKLSVAIAECMCEQDGLDGLLYPTVAMRANIDNLALKPAFVDTALKFSRAEFKRIDSIEGDLKYKVTTLDTANSLSAAGDILWEGPPGQGSFE